MRSTLWHKSNGRLSHNTHTHTACGYSPYVNSPMLQRSFLCARLIPLCPLCARVSHYMWCHFPMQHSALLFIQIMLDPVIRCIFFLLLLFLLLLFLLCHRSVVQSCAMATAADAAAVIFGISVWPGFSPIAYSRALNAHVCRSHRYALTWYYLCITVNQHKSRIFLQLSKAATNDVFNTLYFSFYFIFFLPAMMARSEAAICRSFSYIFFSFFWYYDYIIGIYSHDMRYVLCTIRIYTQVDLSMHKYSNTISVDRLNKQFGGISYSTFRSLIHSVRSMMVDDEIG